MVKLVEREELADHLRAKRVARTSERSQSKRKQDDKRINHEIATAALERIAARTYLGEIANSSLS